MSDAEGYVIYLGATAFEVLRSPDGSEVAIHFVLSAQERNTLRLIGAKDDLALRLEPSEAIRLADELRRRAVSGKD